MIHSRLTDVATENFVNQFIQSKDSNYVKKVFNKFANITNDEILEADLGNALRECGVILTPEEVSVVFKCNDLNDNGGLNFNEFAMAVKTPTKLEQWADTLWLSELLAYCLLLRNRNTDDHLRGVGDLTTFDLLEVVSLFGRGLMKILVEGQSVLRKGFQAMDRQIAESSKGIRASSKFKTFKMGSGKVEDFHKGLLERIGEILA
jgi:hypothetical protein